MIGLFLKQVQGWVKLKGDTDGTKVGNVGDRLKSDSVVSSFKYNTSTLLHMTRSSGLLEGETYDHIVYSEVGNSGILEFDLVKVAQFQLVITVTDQMNWEIFKREPTATLTQEDGDNLLQEDGSNILAQGLLPSI